VTKSSKKSYVWYNRMSLLNKYSNCIGGKNGYTPKAGKTLVSYAKNNGMKLIIVSLNDPQIYANHKKIYSYYFKKYTNYTIVDKKEFNVFPLSDDKKNLYYIKKKFKYPLLESELNRIKTLVKISNLNEHGKVGQIIIKLNDKKIGTLNIYKKSAKKKKENSFFKKLKNYLFDNL